MKAHFFQTSHSHFVLENFKFIHLIAEQLFFPQITIDLNLKKYSMPILEEPINQMIFLSLD